VSLSFLKVVLKGLKQATSEGCSAWDECEGKVTTSNSNVYACSIASKVRWDPWPSKMNKCLFIIEIPFGIDFLKKERNSLKRSVVINVFVSIAIQSLVCKVECNHFISSLH
jgi:hypothetical protein